jgi:hypothetical protein
MQTAGQSGKQHSDGKRRDGKETVELYRQKKKTGKVKQQIFFLIVFASVKDGITETLTEGGEGRGSRRDGGAHHDDNERLRTARSRK